MSAEVEKRQSVVYFAKWHCAKAVITFLFTTALNANLEGENKYFVCIVLNFE